MNLSGKKILVLGLGDTGISAVRWLKSVGAQVVAADSRLSPPRAGELQGIEFDAGPFRQEILEGVDMIVISPGLSLQEPVVSRAIEMGIPVLGDVELFAREIAKKNPRPGVLAITGSNGKSTVTSMVGAMCSKAGLDTVVAGNIGLPVLDTLGGNPTICVLELSSFQLETLGSLNAKVATVLNVSEDHLDRYDSMREYSRVKSGIFSGDGIQVLNRDDPASMAMRLPGRMALTFGLSAPAGENEYGLVQAGEETWLARGGRRLMRVSELHVAGLHNALNALAALALCSALDIPEEKLLAALREFRGLPHRVEKIGEINGVVFYDDSKGTNVGATVAALTGLSEKAVVILGGDGKGQDFTPLRTPIAEHARAVVLIGRDAPAIEKAVAGISVPMLHAGSMEEAVIDAFNAAEKGDAVLLSPACASFDMFRNYAHRAEAFVDAFRILEGEACIRR
ncbi:MAG: UDP-N-acetylmuramoyl-L-alanine--D-glutamate ligase [Burkholderiales bacterium]|nr:UDP-N-acetylmuramoyl-L-alanine--D-glutamate ligase [Burkholderiales bacterium]